jgi:hypothetical protein
MEMKKRNVYRCCKNAKRSYFDWIFPLFLEFFFCRFEEFLDCIFKGKERKKKRDNYLFLKGKK